MSTQKRLYIIFGGVLLLGALALATQTQASDVTALVTGAVGAVAILIGVRR